MTVTGQESFLSRTRIATHRVLHLILALLLLVVGFSVAWYMRYAAAGPLNCQYAPEALPNFVLFGVGVVAVIAGHHLGKLDPRPAPKLTSTTPPFGRRIGHLALVLLLVFGTLVWFYEALGTAHVSLTTSAPPFEPITYYVRCAINHDFASLSGGAISVFVISIVCLVMGHWLWGEE